MLMKKVHKFEYSYFETISDDGDEIKFIETIKDGSVDIEQEIENKIFAEIIWKVAEKYRQENKQFETKLAGKELTD